MTEHSMTEMAMDSLYSVIVWRALYEMWLIDLHWKDSTGRRRQFAMNYGRWINERLANHKAPTLS